MDSSYQRRTAKWLGHLSLPDQHRSATQSGTRLSHIVIAIHFYIFLPPYYHISFVTHCTNHCLCFSDPVRHFTGSGSSRHHWCRNFHWRDRKWRSTSHIEMQSDWLPTSQSQMEEARWTIVTDKERPFE